MRIVSTPRIYSPLSLRLGYNIDTLSARSLTRTSRGLDPQSVIRSHRLYFSRPNFLCLQHKPYMDVKISLILFGIFLVEEVTSMAASGIAVQTILSAES